jgi:hypothetical protein
MIVVRELVDVALHRDGAVLARRVCDGEGTDHRWLRFGFGFGMLLRLRLRGVRRLRCDVLDALDVLELIEREQRQRLVLVTRRNRLGLGGRGYLAPACLALERAGGVVATGWRAEQLRYRLTTVVELPFETRSARDNSVIVMPSRRR